MNELSKYTNDELKAELRRREKVKEVELLASTDYKKRMNTAIKKGYSKETEEEIRAVLMVNPDYENNIQKALAWGLMTKCRSVVEDAIGAYKNYSSMRYFGFLPFGIEMEEILFMLGIDDEVGYRYLGRVLNYWVENELLLLRMKREGGVERLYYDWKGISTGYDREIHRSNRKRIDDVLEQAKEAHPFHKKFRKVVLGALRDVQAGHYECQEDVDVLEAFKFLRWHGARWGGCDGQ